MLKADQNPFATKASVTKEQLIAYASGTLPQNDMHAVELQLESDPFLREALEGLREPGALQALVQLPSSAQPVQVNGVAWVVGTTLLVITASVVLFSSVPPLDNEPQPQNSEAPANVSALPGKGNVPSSIEIGPAEITGSTEVAASIRIGHNNDDLHMRIPASVADPADVTVERMVPNEPVISTEPAMGAIRPEHRKHHSVQLMYLHDLKLIDPKELYARAAMLRVDELGVDASHADRGSLEKAKGDQRMMSYTVFMDGALSKFIRNDHKGCLRDLRLVLVQYPDDVNALFYAGLCSYNLGLYQRARVYLHRASIDPMGVFEEEAQWYHALAMQRVGDTETARSAFVRIRDAKGFYADRAADALKAEH